MNDRSSVSHAYSSKSAERRLLCVTAKLPDQCPRWVIHVTAAVSAPYPIYPKSGHSANPGFVSTRPNR
jgi:hypothetical protein